jgi:hypothetical protein
VRRNRSLVPAAPDDPRTPGGGSGQGTRPRPEAADAHTALSWC